MLFQCDKCKKSKIKTADYKSVKSIFENEDMNALNAIADIDLGLIPTEMIVDELLKRNGITYLRLSETEKQCMIAKGPAILIGVEELI